jgi:pre-mRNA-splicing factor CDC5/CEF1
MVHPCLPHQGNAKRKASAPNTLRLEAARRAHEATRSEMEAQARKAARLDKKCGILIAGLQQRDAKLRSQLDEMATQVCVVCVGAGR